MKTKRTEMFMQSTLGVLALAWIWLGAGCSTPIGVDEVQPLQSYKQINANAINSRKTTDITKAVLHRFDLAGLFRKYPEEALRELFKKSIQDPRRDILFALSELSYEYGDQLRHSVKRGESQRAAGMYLTSAIFAYFYLFDQDKPDLPTAFQREFRVACDLYNRGLGRALASGNGPLIDIKPGVMPVGRGELNVRVDRSHLSTPIPKFERFMLADNYLVRGVTVRNRTGGLGVPVIGVATVTEGFQKTVNIPLTAFLRVQGRLADLGTKNLAADLEVYSALDTDTTEVAGHKVPLEKDLTTSVAYGLENSTVWKLGLAQFFSSVQQVQTGIYMTQPYQPGKAPLVFVHGTASSPVWWVEMWNTLRSDPLIRQHYQFWYFTYNTGNPVPYSAAKLRESLEAKIQSLDPEGKDPTLRQMVVAGHSQGGMLTKLTAVDSGDRFWKMLSDKSIDELNLKPEQKELLQQVMFFKPLPFVRHLIFMSTPHKGSYMAKPLIQKLAARFVRLPGDVIGLSSTLLEFRRSLDIPGNLKSKLPTSIDQMSPGNPWVKVYSEIPVAPGVTTHSIIAVRNPKEDRSEWNDGVVRYESAHLDNSESEVIVHSGHSSQLHPLAIEEVRRILVKYAK